MKFFAATPSWSAGSVCLYLLLAALGHPLCNSSAQETSQPKFFLPQNPVAAAYVLSRLSNQELIEAPRGEFVYIALLQRKGLDRKYRLEALEGLSKIRHTDRAMELLRAIVELDKKGEDSNGVLQELAPLLFQCNPTELSVHRSEIESLAVQAQLSLSKRLGWGARIISEGTGDASWTEAQGSSSHLEDILLAVPLLPEPALRERFYLRVIEILNRDASPSLTDAAAQALVSIPRHDGESFTILANLIRHGRQSTALFESCAHIPSTNWPTNGLGELSEAILEYLEKVPAEQRAEPAFAGALQFESELAARLPVTEGRKLTKELRTLGPMQVTLHAVYEQMRFDKTRIIVETSKAVVITLQNDDAMPHNLAILAPGALQEIGQAAEKMSPQPDSEGRLYVPASPKVLHATKLVGPGQKLELVFNAPAESGEYPYVCTFPGHWLRMSGTMIVVPDVEAYLASHPVAQQSQLTEWKISDFAAELPQSETGRNPALGSELFSKLACVQCHKLGSQGYAYGPDLTDLFKRYKGDRSEILQQILEPSKRIDDRYRNFNFELKGGDSLLGMVLKEDDQNITIQTGPADSLIQVIKKSEIQRRNPQSSSPMPVGLLNSLSKTEIFDLLSYLELGGSISPHEHKHSRADATKSP